MDIVWQLIEVMATPCVFFLFANKRWGEEGRGSQTVISIATTMAGATTGARLIVK